MSGEMSAWLRSLGPDRLGQVLRLRPDAAGAPEPRRMAELAQRLSQRTSVRKALEDVDAVALQVAEVVVALEPLDRAGLERVFGDADPGAVEVALGELRRRALVRERICPSGVELVAAGGLAALWPSPLGLGEPLRALLGRLPESTVSAILAGLGVSIPRGRAAQHTAVVSHLSTQRIRDTLAAAPSSVQALVRSALTDGPYVRIDATLAYQLSYQGVIHGSSPAAWAVRHALLLPAAFDLLVVPREVGRALHGALWRVGVAVHPPPPVPAPADPAARDRAADAATAAALDLVTGVLEDVAGQPLPALKAGGVGVREIRRLAKAHRRAEHDVVLALEVAGAAGLVVAGVGEVVAAVGYDAWRRRSPADQLAELVVAWWRAPYPMTERSDPTTGKPVPPLVRLPDRADVRRLRHDLLRAAGALPPGTGSHDVAALAALVCWRRPLAYPDAAEARVHAERIWAEAAQLGLVAEGAVSRLGRTLIDDVTPDAERWVAGVATAAETGLPATARTVALQADLTAVVSGPPSADLAELLDAAADREARGGASVWRFSPASIRRHLDGGGDAEDLLAALAAAAPRGVPQPLEYLVRDAARRHGTVRVAPVASVLVSEDTALLAEIAASRGLGPLGLRLLAPTVLGSRKPVAETLDRLRAAGYAPVGLTADGAPVVERRLAKRARRPETATGPSSPRRLPTVERVVAPALDAAALAVRLLAADDDAPPAEPDPSGTLELLTQHSLRLQPHELALLAHAADHDGAVLVEYEDTNGTRTERVLSELDVMPPFLVAWCHLRDDERTFTLSRLLSVSPA